MRSLQDRQLFHQQEQEKAEGKAGNEKALSEMQSAYGS
jgi:hypothetical protein